MSTEKPPKEGDILTVEEAMGFASKGLVVGVLIATGEVLLAVYGMPFLLTPDEARAVAQSLLAGADIAGTGKRPVGN